MLKTKTRNIPYSTYVILSSWHCLATMYEHDAPQRIVVGGLVSPVQSRTLGRGDRRTDLKA